MIGELITDIRTTLANKVCKYQSLDVGHDRVRVAKELINMINSGYIVFKKCLGCNGPLDQEEVRNALSRYGHGYICSDCSTQEAIEGDFINNRINNHGKQS